MAMSEPSDGEAVAEIATTTGLGVVAAVAVETSLTAALDRTYSQEGPSPATAPERVLAMVQATAAIGVDIRAGVHQGRVAVVEGDLFGVAVHVGARIGALATKGQVLVSAPVRQAAAGLDFEDRGEHDLRGIPGLWRLYSLLP